MKHGMKNFIRLVIGLFVCSIGIVLTIQANLGLSPWDAFHHGLSKNLGITMGQASMLLGIIVVIVDMFLGENLGVGTILNMFLIGIFMDFFMINNIIPVSTNIVIGFIMLFIGMFIIGIGCVIYIGAGYGSGPRDGLMVALHKKTKRPVKTIKTCIEMFALIFGFILGGSVGIGTVITTLVFGLFIEYSFKLCKFDTNSIKHRYILDDIKGIKYRLFNDSYKECINQTNVDENSH
ncbi:YczE/YyaS/YitT family protein [Paraclostridium bifermentans]